MKKTLVIAVAALAALAPVAEAVSLDPIPGSLTYPTQPKSKLKKAPAGSLVQHNFHSNGSDYQEMYRVEPNRDLKLLNRRKVVRE